LAIDAPFLFVLALSTLQNADGQIKNALHGVILDIEFQTSQL